MAESIQRILKRWGLEGHHPQTPEQITEWLEAAARGWNADPTPFEWAAIVRPGADVAERGDTR